MDSIDIYSQLGDLKEIDYRNTLAIASMIEVLVDKGIIDRKDIAKKAHELDTMSIDELRLLRTR